MGYPEVGCYSEQSWPLVIVSLLERLAAFRKRPDSQILGAYDRFGSTADCHFPLNGGFAWPFFRIKIGYVKLY